MLLEFSVGNFRSIRDIESISFVASSVVSKNKEVDETNVFQATDKLRVLKTLAIYGANASGKSNFIKAIYAFKAIVTQSLTNENILAFIEPYLLSTETNDKPTFFQIHFIIEGVVYRYGFETNTKEITAEWLFGTPNSREIYYFKRDFQKLDINKKQFTEAHKLQTLLEGENPIFRKNALLISTLATFNNELSQKIYSEIRNLSSLINLDNSMFRNATDAMIFSDDAFKEKTTELLRYAAVGIDSLLVIDNSNPKDSKHPDYKFQSNPKRIATLHKQFDGELNLIDKPVLFMLDSNESEGTKKLYELAPFIFTTLENGGTLIIDEFDARLHPRLSKKIIEIFNDPRTNPKNAQLLVVTHDTNLLSANLFRRDQILFVEKDKYGASHLYSLAAFKGVRNDASFESDYLMGRYGAVPFLNNLNAVFAN